MGDASRLIKLVADTEPIFRSCDKKSLKNVLAQLSAFLMDGDDCDTEIIDAVWHAAQQLQACLAEEGELEEEALAAIHQSLKFVADRLHVNASATPKENAAPLPSGQLTIPKEDLSLIEDFIVETSEHLETAEGAMIEIENNQGDSDTLNLIFRSFHTIKGMACFMNLDEIGALAHEAENLLDLARKVRIEIINENTDAIFQALDMLKAMTASLREAIETDHILMPQKGAAQITATLRQAVQYNTKAAAPTPIASLQKQPEKAAVSPAPIPEPVIETPRTRKTTSLMDEKIKVSTARLDSLVNMVGELVIAHLLVTESIKPTMATNRDLQRNAAHQSKIIRELQELSMSMRMIPIYGLFQKMARVTRDLAHKAGKIIDFEIEGEQTELDRNIVDLLADPLIHMIRNAVDHGLETPKERILAGKTKVGKIELRASHLAGNVVVELMDNGRGLDRAKLIEKAIESGLTGVDETLSDQEAFQLIFHPGLSTAREITSVSGRGVGMDIVKRNIEELSGRIDIDSTRGCGTTFTITLPLTLAIIDGQIVRVGSEKYIIPINVIRKSFCPEPCQLSSIHGRGEMVMVRDALLPLVRLHELFGIEAEATDATDGLLVVVEKNNEACCLLVDDLLDQQQVVIKNLGQYLKRTPGISGGAIMGDGRVSLILDIAGIIRIFRNREEAIPA